jgi:ATP-dependent DNA helicase RecG
VSPASAAFDEARRSLEQPLRFVCRGGLAALERVRDLEATLSAAARRLRDAAPDPQARALAEAVLAAIPAPQDPPATRLERLQACLDLLDGRLQPPPMRTGHPERGARGGEASAGPSRRAERGAREGEALAGASRRAERAALDGRLQPPSERADVQYLRGVGPKLGALLHARGLRTVRDLLFFLPRRYDDRRAASAIKDLVPGQSATVEAEVQTRAYKAFRGRRQLDVLVGDDTGVLQLRWFRVPGASFADRFERVVRLRVSGVVKLFRGRFEMVHPELGAAVGVVEDALVPVYPEVEGLRPAHLRRIVQTALPAASGLEEQLPAWLREKRGLPALAESVQSLHAPPEGSTAAALSTLTTPWHRRLIYEELLLLQLGVLRRKAAVQLERATPLRFAESLEATGRRLFPFALTSAQRRALAQLEADLSLPVPMQRLLQGDVGSGKTAVALTAAAATVAAGLQVAIMAPTEILAEQHARSALRSLDAAGIRVELLTSAVSAGERRRILGQLASGHIKVLLGTHAVIQDDVRFQALGLAVIDEQHRFGVTQRAALQAKGRDSTGALPHTLVMTATPIPRTLALTLYGDLDVSVIDELPPGRTPIRTQVFREQQRTQVYERVRHAALQGRQAYIVYPLVSESEGEGMEGIGDATSAAEELAAGPLAGIAVGLLHGRMSGDDKERVMRAFSGGDIAVLVATTVVEVGVDVPNATVMVIEHAERFGLSQLHQLRGRVGRGAHASECLLVAHQVGSEEAWRRLAAMEETQDGFVLAEEDLRLRGPGDFIGTRQSGLPLLTLADLTRDHELLVWAREDAALVLARDPGLTDPAHRGLADLWRSLSERGLTLA